MISSSMLSLVLLAFTGLISAKPSPDQIIAPENPPPPSGYVGILTDDAVWISACGRSSRVGAVCLSAENGDRELYEVQRSAYQDVVFSKGGNYLMAYCPNLTKGEKPYKLQYGQGNAIVYYVIQGRASFERCCKTQYINPNGDASAVQCIAPTVGAAAVFPPEEIIQ